MRKKQRYDAMFSGIIGQDYDLLKLICPLSTEMSRLVGEAVANILNKDSLQTLKAIELGGGTGITTLAILTANDYLRIYSVDNEPNMQRQAQVYLQKWVDAGRLEFCANDALTALSELDENSFDVMASAYTLHNFESDYRDKVINEIYRVLKPGGYFINGDRYGLDDISLHTQTIQQEVAGYFRVLTQHKRLDLLEHWIIHLFNDESENHVMREKTSLQQLADAGFRDVSLAHRIEVNAVVQARK
jgi:tRNA (cmo5U34)-methyltransferase